MRLVAGTVVLDRYRVIVPPTSQDARGPLALALDQRLRCHVDLVIAPQPVGTPQGALWAQRARAVALLQHPSLPPVLDMGLQGGHVVLVYRHAAGRLLAGITAQEARDWTDQRVLHVVADLAAALGLAHAHGLCHGSFSAHSVLMEHDGMVTILDLAWPRRRTALDRADVAPEVRMGQPPTPRADVFALGQVLRRLAHARGYGAGRALDGAVLDVVRRATAREPRARYADGAALAQAVESLLATLPSAEASVSAPRPHVARQHPRVAAAPAAPHPAGRGTQASLRGALLPLALSLAIGLLPVAGVVAGVVAQDVMGHMPPVEFPQQLGSGPVPYGNGWRGGWHWWWHHHATAGSWAP